MKQTLEEAAKEYWDKWLEENPNANHTRIVSLGFAFIAGAEWQSKQTIEILSSVLENWVHGGDADCIIAEFEEKLNNL
jgi:hypothetical protein